MIRTEWFDPEGDAITVYARPADGNDEYVEVGRLVTMTQDFDEAVDPGYMVDHPRPLRSFTFTLTGRGELPRKSRRWQDGRAVRRWDGRA